MVPAARDPVPAARDPVPAACRLLSGLESNSCVVPSGRGSVLAHAFWVGGERLTVKGKLASLTAFLPAAPDSQPLATFGATMSQHTPPPRHRNNNHRCLPLGRRKLIALEVAVKLVVAIQTLRLPRGLAHLRDHLHRAADNTALRLSEADGRTMGNRYQHLEAAFAENQEVQTALELIKARKIEVPVDVIQQADRLGALIYGLLRADKRVYAS
jgi:four helix bundle protein